MSGLRLEGVEKRFGAIVAVGDAHLHFPEGQFFCLLGPSGCGKTTLLRIVAGLIEPDAGRVLLDDDDITDVPAHRRNFGMVFQSLALFPHLTVGENIAYGLRIRKVERAARRKRCEELLELVRLPGVADRHVSQLSGGQRQRVAMARALALEPRLFLLDEPLSALDAKLREDMQVELRQLQQRIGVTTILVTHDQREAMTMSDRVVVMNEGRVAQVGPPLEIYRSPANTFVADFIGTSNLLPAVVAAAGRVTVAGEALAVAALPDGLGPGAEATISVRPESVHVLPDSAAGENRLPGRVTFVRDVGVSVETYLDCAGHEVISIASPKDRPDVRQGDRVLVELPAADIVVLSA